MKIHKLHFLWLVLVLARSGEAVLQSFPYKTESCTCNATYDPQVMSSQQAADSALLASGEWRYQNHRYLVHPPYCASNDVVPKEDRETVMRDLNETISYLKSLNVVPALKT